MRPSERMLSNVNTLANATELTAQVIERVAGEDISNRINGQPVRLSDLSDAIAAKIQLQLNKRVTL